MSSNTIIIPGAQSGIQLAASSSIINDIVINTQNPTFTATGHSVTFDLDKDQLVMLNVQMSINCTGGVGSLILRYDLGGVKNNLLFKSMECDVTGTELITMTRVIGPLAAGQHTIFLEAAKGNTLDVTMYGTNDTLAGREQNYLQVVTIG